MISSDLMFHGFGAETWTNLLSLFGYRHPAHHLKRPSLVVIDNADGQAVAMFRTGSGAVPVSHYKGRAALAELCEATGCRQATVIRDGALDTLRDRMQGEMNLAGDYIEQWLTLVAALRKAEGEGMIQYWPPRPGAPPASAAMVERAIDLLLPDGRSIVVAVWEHGRLWTACALRRQGGKIDTIAGPGSIQRWTGPLSGDHRRDHRAIARAVGAQLAPVHLGVYALRRDLERLLRASEPGSWLTSVALRELILSPAPVYAGVALGADAARVAASRTRTFLGGLDLFAQVEPVVTRMRSHLGQATSVTGLLGFNPLERLAERLKRSDRN